MSEPKHPAPWKWEADDVSGSLLDANGKRVVGNADYRGEEVVTDIATGELLSLAPEMEALLREHEWSGSNLSCPECHGLCTSSSSKPHNGHDPDCDWAAILARIDAARGTT